MIFIEECVNEFKEDYPHLNFAISNGFFIDYEASKLYEAYEKGWIRNKSKFDHAFARLSEYHSFWQKEPNQQLIDKFEEVLKDTRSYSQSINATFRDALEQMIFEGCSQVEDAISEYEQREQNLYKLAYRIKRHGMRYAASMTHNWACTEFENISNNILRELNSIKPK